MSFDLRIISGDLDLTNGDIQTVTDSEKLIQDILKICLTDIGSNVLNPWYGSYLSKFVIGSALNDSEIVNIGQVQLQTALETFKKLQDMQVKSQQRMSPDEQLAAISEISVNRNESDPRLFNVLIKVLTKGLKPITTRFTVSTI